MIIVLWSQLSIISESTTLLAVTIKYHDTNHTVGINIDKMIISIKIQ